MEIKIVNNNEIDAFGAYAVDENLIFINVEACLITSIEENIPFKEMLLETIGHEFMHCLEEKLNLEFDEDRVERIISTYKEKYKNGKKDN